MHAHTRTHTHERMKTARCGESEGSLIRISTHLSVNSSIVFKTWNEKTDLQKRRFKKKRTDGVPSGLTPFLMPQDSDRITMLYSTLFFVFHYILPSLFSIFLTLTAISHYYHTHTHIHTTVLHETFLDHYDYNDNSDEQSEKK